MRLLAICWFLLLRVGALKAQPAEYQANVRKAEEQLSAKDYAAAAQSYSAAFKSFGWRALQKDRYNAARAWAMSGVADSAFFNLYRIVEKLKFDNLDQVTAETNFQPLYKDARWTDLCTKIKANQPAMPELSKELRAIYEDDQKYRLMIESVEKKYGHASAELHRLLGVINEKDSINLLKITAILDQHGWLGPDKVGYDGSQTLFLVIQHNELSVQEKYLPMMREAVKNGNARGADLALLEDRVNMRNGRKQIYGSQIGQDHETGAYWIFPIEDPKNVDKRRAEVGLGNLSEYVSTWGLLWNEEEAEKMEKTPFDSKK